MISLNRASVSYNLLNNKKARVVESNFGEVLTGLLSTIQLYSHM